VIALQRETLYDVMEDVAPLLELHYRELTMHKERIALDPVWERYAALEKQGSIALFTARVEEKLVGYSAFFVQSHIHYERTLVASNDVLFLHPDYRKGSCGIKLIRFSEQQLKAQGVDKITWHVKFSKDFRPILHRLGYVDEEVTVGKIL
jgi:GNAT superfamily N-acetyltransferase